MPTNRISQYLAEVVPDFDSPPFADRLRAVRILCFLLIAIVLVSTISVISVVTMALGGRPLSGNAGMVSGVPIITVIAAFSTLTCAAIASFIVPLIWARGIKRVKSTPADAPEEGANPETEQDRLWRVYTAGKFAEFALAEGAAILTAVLFHLTADWLMMAFIAAMVAFMIVRFPTAAKAREWFAAME